MKDYTNFVRINVTNLKGENEISGPFTKVTYIQKEFERD